MISKADFWLEGGNAGVLLIHGLTGTPAEMRWVGQGLNRCGFSVSGMQLAGHCGNEQDLLKTNWRDWLESVYAAADVLQARVDHLFVAGLSMGALLALKLAAERPEKVAGVGSYGATFRYDGWSVPLWSRWASHLLPLVKPMRLGTNRRFVERPPYGIKDERLRQLIFESMSKGDSAAAGLIGNPWCSLADMYELAGVVRRDLRRVVAPTLVVHASNDDVAHVRNAQVVVRGVGGPSELVLLDNSYHMVTVDRERGTVIQRTSRYFKSIADGAASRPAQEI